MVTWLEFLHSALVPRAQHFAVVVSMQKLPRDKEVTTFGALRLARKRRAKKRSHPPEHVDWDASYLLGLDTERLLDLASSDLSRTPYYQDCVFKELESRVGWRGAVSMLTSRGPQAVAAASRVWGSWLGAEGLQPSPGEPGGMAGTEAPAAAAPDPFASVVRPDAQRQVLRKRLRSSSKASPHPDSRLTPSPLSGGQALPEAVRRRFELLVGAPLGDVRIHTGSEAARMAEELGAEAFAVGRDIYFADGRFAPESADGWKLLAHELTHVLQAQEGRVPAALGEQHRAHLEAEADEVARGLGVDDPHPGRSRTPASRAPAMGAESMESAPQPGAPLASKAATGTSRLVTREVVELRQADFSLPADAEAHATPNPRRPLEQGTQVASRNPQQQPSVVGSEPTKPDGGPVGKPATEALNPPANIQEPAHAALQPPGKDLDEERELEQTSHREQRVGIQALPAASTVVAAAHGVLGKPPSLLVQTYTQLGDALHQGAQAEAQGFGAGLPEVQVVETGRPAPPRADVVAPSAQIEVPTPKSPTVSPARFKPVTGAGTKARAPSQSKQDIQSALENMDVRSHGISTELETTPRLEGGGDQADALSKAALAQAQDIQKRAAIGLWSGKGPEQLQRQPMKATAVVPAPTRQITITPTEALEEIEELKAQPMDKSLRAAFDLVHGPRIAKATGEVESRLATATAERDAARSQALGNADQQSKQLKRQGQQQQDVLVGQARVGVDHERVRLAGEQAQAVKALEIQATQERGGAKQEIDARVRQDQRQVDTVFSRAQGEVKREVARAEAKANAEKNKAKDKDESWWSQAIDFVVDAFNAVVDAIRAVFAEVRRRVVWLMNAARKEAGRLLASAAAWVKSRLVTFSKWLKEAVNAVLKAHLPKFAKALNDYIDRGVKKLKAAVDSVHTFVKANLTKIAKATTELLDKALATFEKAIIAGKKLGSALLKGEFAEVARMLLEAALQLIGIKPEDFYAFFGKAKAVLSKILANPKAFALNLWAAAKAGFGGFTSKFGTYLKQGLVGWLTGALGGIQVPETLDLKGIFSVATQVLGLDREYLRKKAIKRFGEKRTAKVERFMAYVDTLLTKGLGGLWDEVKGRLENLYDVVVGGVMRFLTEKVVKIAIVRLATMFNPAGALANLLLTAYNMILFLKDQMARIIGVIKAITGSVSDIVDAKLKNAAAKVEGALAMAVPVAIDLLAKLVGVTGVPAAVRRIIGDLRERIDRAVDKIMGRLSRKARRHSSAKTSGTGEAGKKADPDKSDKSKVKASGSVPFKMGGEAHTLFMPEKKGQAIEMASRRERLSKKIGDAVARLMKEEPPPRERIAALKALGGQVKTAERGLGSKSSNDLAIGLARAVAAYGDQFKVKDIGKSDESSEGSATWKALSQEVHNFIVRAQTDRAISALEAYLAKDQGHDKPKQALPELKRQFIALGQAALQGTITFEMEGVKIARINAKLLSLVGAAAVSAKQSRPTVLEKFALDPKPMPDLAEQVRGLVAKGQLDRALGTLIKATRTHSNLKGKAQEVAQLGARWSRVEDAVVMGVVSHESAEIEKNRVRLATLELLDILPGAPIALEFQGPAPKQERSEFVAQVQSLITRNQVGRALDTMSQYFTSVSKTPKMLRRVQGLQGRQRQLLAGTRAGTKGQGKAELQTNKLVNEILELLRQLAPNAGTGLDKAALTARAPAPQPLPGLVGQVRQMLGRAQVDRAIGVLLLYAEKPPGGSRPLGSTQRQDLLQQANRYTRGHDGHIARTTSSEAWSQTKSQIMSALLALLSSLEQGGGSGQVPEPEHEPKAFIAQCRRYIGRGQADLAFKVMERYFTSIDKDLALFTASRHLVSQIGEVEKARQRGTAAHGKTSASMDRAEKDALNLLQKYEKAKASSTSPGSVKPEDKKSLEALVLTLKHRVGRGQTDLALSELMKALQTRSGASRAVKQFDQARSAAIALQSRWRRMTNDTHAGTTSQADLSRERQTLAQNLLVLLDGLDGSQKISAIGGDKQKVTAG